MTDSTPPKTPHTTARYFLEGLQETGIRYLFSNLGTDHVTLIDEMARLQAEGKGRASWCMWMPARPTRPWACTT
jgi:acetolactate synthase-1/2/3 large subunit